MSVAHFDGVKRTAGRGGLVRGAFVGSLATLLARVVDIILLWQQRAAERHHLSTLGEHHLKDIGLSRADADIEASKRFWQA